MGNNETKGPAEYAEKQGKEAYGNSEGVDDLFRIIEKKIFP
jgi:hypothetical protein